MHFDDTLMLPVMTEQSIRKKNRATFWFSGLFDSVVEHLEEERWATCNECNGKRRGRIGCGGNEGKSCIVIVVQTKGLKTFILV